MCVFANGHDICDFFACNVSANSKDTPAKTRTGFVQQFLVLRSLALFEAVTCIAVVQLQILLAISSEDLGHGSGPRCCYGPDVCSKFNELRENADLQSKVLAYIAVVLHRQARH